MTVNTTSSGTILNGRLLVAKDKALNQGVFLILHGTLGHYQMEIINGLQLALEERSYSSLAINLSLGLNAQAGKMFDCGGPHLHKHDDSLDELNAWLEWLAKKGVQKVALVGHSRGGNQVARFAAERKNSIISELVLIAPTTWNRQRAIANYKKIHTSELAEPLFIAERLVALGKGKELIENIGFLYCKNTKASAESFLSYYKPDERFNSVSVIGKVLMPLLIIAGSEDRISEGLIEQIEPKVENDRLKLLIVDGADHFFRDLFLEDVADEMVDFVSWGK